MRSLTLRCFLMLAMAPLGCAMHKNKAEAPMYASGGGGSADYGAAESTADMPMLEPTMTAPPSPSDDVEVAYERESSRRGRWRDRDDDGRSEEPEPPARQIASPATTPAKPEAKPADPAVEDPRKDIGGRMIIYTAGMRISVFNLEEAIEKAESLPERFGGYVHSMNAGEFVLKIPARKLRAAMKELAGYGVVEQRSLSTQDVSAEYVDIESRIRALEGTHKQLLELLSKARTVDEALHVRQALDQVASELEVLKGRMRQLDSLISFSTLTLSMYERGPHTPTPTSNDPFPWVDSLGVEATEWK